ncbi:MAG: DNA repair protein RadA [Candidatus Gracilibacteria bacterium]|nr:DNA repair protein RadA [Candidatus Gracilibacteria bacterium]
MFRCRECGATSQKWQGKCGTCGEWSTLEEEIPLSKNKKQASGKEQKIFNILPSGENTPVAKVQLRSNELNTVLGTGLTPGSLILLSGEPGIGKSTLALQITDWFSDRNKRAIYVSAEENVNQVSDRANRLGIVNEHIRLFTANTLEDILETLEQDASELIIIDSVSMISSLDVTSQSGSITQIRYVTEVFMEFSKRTGRSIILIGHVTKEGTISGPKILEHLVDTVLFLEGSKHEDYRILRALKNRFGPTDEIGLFRMTETGLIDIANPGLEFVDQENEHLSGSALGITLEGNRPIVIEIEALSTYTKFGYPKRSARGIPNGKIDLLIAVLSKWSDTKLESDDVYVNIARGLSISEPGIDLATVAAIISSKKNKPLEKRIFIGEISLTGIVKNVFGLQKRFDEAVKLGFTEIFLPKNTGVKIKKGTSVHITEVGHIGELGKKL